MSDLTPEAMADKLMAANFARGGPVAQAASDPIAETPMVVTLDELRPYELDPRLTRNPLYDDIKASIRERGLDAPPPITRRPGADHFIIRNGGNTRLSILRELWSETRDERFFRIACLFRPWSARGEIIALSGHLAESELHGRLTFIERALGVEKMRELYEQESDKPFSQSDLARQLRADGYPISQSHISRMQDTVHYLLPCIPNVLYKGLGRRQTERLTMLRKSAALLWSTHATAPSLPTDFESLFHDVLVAFDTEPDAFAVERVQDELIGQMAKLLGIPYNQLELDIDNIENRQRVISRPPAADEPTLSSAAPIPAPASAPATDASPEPVVVSTAGDNVAPPTDPQGPKPETSPPSTSVQAPTSHETSSPDILDDGTAARVRDHIVSPAVSTDRLQTIQQLVAEHMGESPSDFADQTLRAIPVQAGGLYPISDVWYIEPGLDSAERLRIHIAQFAREIAAEADLIDRIEALNAGIGFTCAPLPDNPDSTMTFTQAVQALLRALSVHYATEQFLVESDGSTALNRTLGSLLLGSDGVDTEAMPRLSDNGLVKLFRLIRLARRLLDLQAQPDEPQS